MKKLLVCVLIMTNFAIANDEENVPFSVGNLPFVKDIIGKKDLVDLLHADPTHRDIRNDKDKEKEKEKEIIAHGTSSINGLKRVLLTHDKNTSMYHQGDQFKKYKIEKITDRYVTINGKNIFYDAFKKGLLLYDEMETTKDGQASSEPKDK